MEQIFGNKCEKSLITLSYYPSRKSVKIVEMLELLQNRKKMKKMR